MNVAFSITQTFYILGVTTWIVGDLLIGAGVLPIVFRFFPERAQAGALASLILARFAKIKMACFFVILVSSLIKFFSWEQASPFISARYVCLFGMAITLAISALYLSPKLQEMRPLIAGLSPDHPQRVLFGQFHAYSVKNGMVGVLLGVIALLLS